MTSADLKGSTAMSDLLPRRASGRQSAEAIKCYQEKLKAFCAELQQVASGLEFKVSSRGWGYILEGRGLITKVDLDKAEKLINDCRKSGHLPLDFCREDDGRQTVNLEEITDEDTEEFAQNWVDYLVGRAHEQFTPFSFWEDQEVYIEMTVEKVDLLSLFEPICKRFRIPITNISGWSDINKRAAIMKRFAYWEAEGKRCILLHCGDHDPGGLHISDFIRSNMEDLTNAVGWSPDDLTIDRFGLERPLHRGEQPDLDRQPRDIERRAA